MIKAGVSSKRSSKRSSFGAPRGEAGELRPGETLWLVVWDMTDVSNTHTLSLSHTHTHTQACSVCVRVCVCVCVRVRVCVCVCVRVGVFVSSVMGVCVCVSGWVCLYLGLCECECVCVCVCVCGWVCWSLGLCESVYFCEYFLCGSSSLQAESYYRSTADCAHTHTHTHMCVHTNVHTHTHTHTPRGHAANRRHEEIGEESTYTRQDREPVVFCSRASTFLLPRLYDEFSHL